MDIHELNSSVFGHSSFREGQMFLISSILEGRDCLGIMPTGGGKSLCYQIPAMTPVSYTHLDVYKRQIQGGASSVSLKCDICFHHCELDEGRTGLCRARANRGGQIVPLNYGRLTSLALDPIEKKPLRRFHPGGLVLSLGSFGCNLRCPFCQNAEIDVYKRQASACSRASAPPPSRAT